MRTVLTLFALMTLGVFAIIAAVDGGTTSVAGSTTSATSEPTRTVCGDDGDEGDGDPADDPDSDEDSNEFSAADDADDDDDTAAEDSEDMDPVDEYDDCPPFDAEPTVGDVNETPEPTFSPSPTPCPTYNPGAAADECCVPASGVNAQIPPCYCDQGPYCCIADVSLCGDEGDDPVEAEVASTDFDCDGQTTTADALGTLSEIGGADSEDSGDSCEDSEDVPGDSDCSGSIDPKDAVLILAVVAELEAEVC